MELLAQTNEAAWERLLLGYGPLGLIVIGIAWMIWKYAPRLIEGHINLMSTLEKTAQERGVLDQRNTEALETLSQSRLAAEDSGVRTAHAIQEIAGTQKKMAEDLSKQTDLLSRTTDLQKSIHDQVTKIPQMLINVNAPEANRVEMHELTSPPRKEP